VPLVAHFRIRWSQLESQKPFARPLGVLFFDDQGRSLPSVAVSGADLLFYEQFRAEVLSLLGEVFTEPSAETAGDTQRAWLDLLSELLPSADVEGIVPVPVQDADRGVHHVFAITLAGGAERPMLEAEQVLDYQEFQAAVAHQSGRLFRDHEVEAVEDHGARRRLWSTRVSALLPGADELRGSTSG
jgi:hypothetical protein